VQFSQRSEALVTNLMQLRLLDVHLHRLSEIVHGETEDPKSDVHRRSRKIRGAISFKDVHFRYARERDWTLRGLDFHIAPGEFVAITGVSGGGKSTILKLVLGLYAPTRGEVLIDEAPLAAVGIDTWRHHTGCVLQDDVLFAGTFASNIACFSTQIDMQQVIRASELAQIHEEIMKLPASYSSMISDLGAALSGGQRQRLLLARALYRQPKVLVLDEGTANLDAQTEIKIADVIASMDCTRLVVAHRPELLRRADRILMLEHGTLRDCTRDEEGDVGGATNAASTRMSARVR
jgi:ATP-binding cassette subfamily B protein RaxB